MVPGEMDMPGSAELNDSPCWQDIYDDDCSMSNIYAANFIASKWIKSMPCGAGIEDCDMPAELHVPSAHQDRGIEKTDVMAFLGLKRAASVDAPTEGKGDVS